MSAGIHKKGQGYWTRLMSALSYGLVVAMGGVWLWKSLEGKRIGDLEPVFIQAGAVIVLFAIFGWLGYDLIGRRPRVVDFLIATEGEMKKVHWSTRKEILGSTWVVIGLTIFIAILCASYDFLFGWFFQSIDVLKTGG